MHSVPQLVPLSNVASFLFSANRHVENHAIAAALALGALEWNCFTVKLRDPSEFVAASNPHERQFFWVDDAFGASQLDWQMTSEWNANFSPYSGSNSTRSQICLHIPGLHLQKRQKFSEGIRSTGNPGFTGRHSRGAAVKRRAGANPLQLYSPRCSVRTFKRQLKPHLDTVAAHQRFSPRSHGVLEIRLHEQLLISSSALNDFVGRPVQLLHCRLCAVATRFQKILCRRTDRGVVVNNGNHRRGQDEPS
ncbi:hypothetical protein ACVIIY_002421 [Bradyrhizobium sp. USDA 4515]